MDTVYELLQEKSARELTMEEIAKRAGVGKQTLYKWWPTKATLILAMFSERISRYPDATEGLTAEEALRLRMQRLITAFAGPLGKVVADIISEGQSEHTVLREFYDKHVRQRREKIIASIEHGKATGELRPDTDPELLIDALFGAIYYRLLFKSAPLTERYSDELLDQVLCGVRLIKTTKREATSATDGIG